jgi:L-fucose mutarotase
LLLGIPKILSPDLLKVLAEMGHGDVLVFADAHFPAASIAKNCELIRCDGHNNTDLLDAILQVFPLDRSVEHPVKLMQVQECDKGLKTPVWDEYKKIVAKYDDRGEKAFGSLERFEFYEVAKKAYAVIATSELALYGCFMIQKGVIAEK